MTKEELHAELERIVPAGTKARSVLRMVGHALIELGYIERVECMYDQCVMPTCEFAVASVESGLRSRGIATIDHRIALCDDGNDRPQNLQLMHFACNARKGALEGYANNDARERHAQSSRDRWEDPIYRARITGRERTPEQRASASAKMKAHWADPAKKAVHAKAAADGRWGKDRT